MCSSLSEESVTSELDLGLDFDDVRRKDVDVEGMDQRESFMASLEGGVVDIRQCDWIELGRMSTEDATL